MLVVPPIPRVRPNEVLNFRKVNHIIKRIEYAANLFDIAKEKIETEIETVFKIPGNIVGYGSTGIGQPIRAIYYDGTQTRYIDEKNVHGLQYAFAIKGNRVLLTGLSGRFMFYNISSNTFSEKYVLPFLSNVSDFEGDFVVGSFSSIYGFIYNIKTNTTDYIAYPELNVGQTQITSISGNKVLVRAFTPLFSPSSPINIGFYSRSYIYDIRKNKNLQSSYTLIKNSEIYSYTGSRPDTSPSSTPISIQKIRGNSLVGALVRLNVSGISQFPDSFYGNLSGSVNFMGAGINSRATSISKNFVIGWRDIKLNYTTPFVYNINTGKFQNFDFAPLPALSITDIDIP